LNLDKSINNLSQRLDKLDPEIRGDTNHNDGINYWKGKKIVPLNHWIQIKKDYNLQAALQFFPDDHPHYGLHYFLDNIEDPKLKAETEKWYSEYERLMEHRRNPVYGRVKCFRCLLSPDREQAAIFLGITKVIAKAVERQQNVSHSIYPCPVLNIFECPYVRKKDKEVCEKQDETVNLDVNGLFELSDIAFQLELALAKAQIMTKSNDTVYDANFETGKVIDITASYHGSSLCFYTYEPLEEKLTEVTRKSKVPIRNADDIYHALTNRETLDKVLDQGLDKEYQKHKDDMVKFFMIIKDNIRKEDLFDAQNSDAFRNDDSWKRIHKYQKCSIVKDSLISTVLTVTMSGYVLTIGNSIELTNTILKDKVFLLIEFMELKRIYCCDKRRFSRT
jgi:hypothetical protein